MGIEIDSSTLAVKFIQSNERIDNSLANNPSKQRSASGEEVFAIFRRIKSENGDGNPLIYALKKKDNYSISRSEVGKFVPYLLGSISALAPHVQAGAVMAAPSNHKIAEILARRIARVIGLQILQCGFIKKKNSLVAGELQARLQDPALREGDRVPIKKIISAIEKNPHADFTMKNVNVQHRKYVEPLYWDTNVAFTQGVPLLLVDDLLASGQSIAVMKRLLIQLGAPQVQSVCLLGSLDRYVKI